MAAIRLQIHSNFSSSQTKLKNVVGIYLQSSTTLCSLIHRQQIRSPSCRGRREPFRREMFLFNGWSLPLSCLFNSCYYNTVYRTFTQVPFILSHPTWISSLQEKMLVDSNPHMGIIENSQIKTFSVVSGFDYESEVQRVCNVIEELFVLDRNMETVLDDCRNNITRGVLGRTKQFETLISLIDEMGDKGLVRPETFQICIKAFAAAKQRRKAVGIFELMKKYKFKVGVDSINCLLDNLGRVKLGKEARFLFDKLKGSFTPNMQTLLNGWCKVGNILEAGKMWNPDIVACNTMLEGLLKVHERSDAVKIRDSCIQKRMKEAVEYYESMLSYVSTPDAAVYTCLFGNQKQMAKVYGLLTEMREKEFLPDGRMDSALIKLMTICQML